MRVAILQMDITDGEPETNRVRAASMLADTRGAHLILLPELWTTGYAMSTWQDAADRDTPFTVAWMAAEARRRRAYIGGSLVSRDAQGRLVNRFWLCPPDESPPVAYDKAHLFPALREHAHFAPGGQRVLTPVGPFQAALSICFDLRFPEQYRKDAVTGADLFLVVAEWPHPRGHALRLFAQARAAENQAWLVLANRAGPSADGHRFCGQSMIVAPDGTIMSSSDDLPAIISGVLDADASSSLRAGFPVLPLRQAGVDY